MKLRRHIRRAVGILAFILVAGAGPMTSAEDKKGVRVEDLPKPIPRPWIR